MNHKILLLLVAVVLVSGCVIEMIPEEYCFFYFYANKETNAYAGTTTDCKGYWEMEFKRKCDTLRMVEWDCEYSETRKDIGWNNPNITHKICSCKPASYSIICCVNETGDCGSDMKLYTYQEAVRIAKECYDNGQLPQIEMEKIPQ